YLEERHQVDTAALFERIHDVIRKTLLSASRAIAATIRQSCRDKRSCFELFGFDILLDEKLKPWLMEVNISPSLNTNSQLDKVTKGELVRGLFNLVGVPPFQRRVRSPEEAAALAPRGYRLRAVAGELTRRPKRRRRSGYQRNGRRVRAAGPVSSPFPFEGSPALRFAERVLLRLAPVRVDLPPDELDI
ncbi:MAG: tubulin-tyrosine ligase family-domain-containing protein, partial [Olpidium bornovanus]